MSSEGADVHRTDEVGLGRAAHGVVPQLRRVERKVRREANRLVALSYQQLAPREAVRMAYNVLLRYFFRTGSVAMQELEWHLMAPICMLGLSYAILEDGHVQVDILFGRFPERLRRVIEFISTVLVVVVIAILLS